VNLPSPVHGEAERIGQIDDTAAQYYGTVDLSKQRIPRQVTVAVGEFQTCAGDVAERGVEDVGLAVLNWASAQAKGQRKQSADALKEQLFRELLTFMMEDARTIPRAIRLILISRFLERVADHATNIAEMVIYMVESKMVRHTLA